MNSQSYTHDGLERLQRGVDAVSRSVEPASTSRSLPIILLTGLVSAVVAGATRWLGSHLDDGFALEWIVAWAIALITIVVFAKGVFAASGWLLAASRRSAADRRLRRQDAQLMELAHHDPRVLAEIRAAQCRAEAAKDAALARAVQVTV